MNTVGLSKGKMVAYSVTEAALLMISFMFSSQYMFFMTDILEIAAGAAGTMFLITRIWDAINDPIMGIIADKNKSRHGKYRPFILIGGIPLAVSLPFAFTDFQFSPGWSLAYVYLLYTIFGMAYTCIFIPYTSMIGMLTNSRQERMNLSAMKGGFQSIGVLIASTFTVPLVKRFGGTGELNAQGYQRVALLYMVIALIMFCITFFFVKEKEEPADQQTQKYKLSFRLFADVILKNWNLMILATVYFFMYLRMFLNNSSMMYFFVYVQKRPGNIPYYMMIVSAFIAVMAMVLPPFARKYGKLKITVGSMFLATAAYLLLYLNRFSSTPVFLICTCLVALFSAAPYLLIWSFVTDVADETHQRTGIRADGLMVSTTSFTNKLGAAVAGAVVGAVLGATGYVPNAEQSPSVVLGIESLMFILPGICCAMIAILLLMYKIKDD